MFNIGINNQCPIITIDGDINYSLDDLSVIGYWLESGLYFMILMQKLQKLLPSDQYEYISSQIKSFISLEESFSEDGDSDANDLELSKKPIKTEE